MGVSALERDGAAALHGVAQAVRNLADERRVAGLVVGDVQADGLAGGVDVGCERAAGLRVVVEGPQARVRVQDGAKEVVAAYVGAGAGEPVEQVDEHQLLPVAGGDGARHRVEVGDDHDLAARAGQGDVEEAVGQPVLGGPHEVAELLAGVDRVVYDDLRRAALEAVDGRAADVAGGLAVAREDRVHELGLGRVGHDDRHVGLPLDVRHLRLGDEGGLDVDDGVQQVVVAAEALVAARLPEHAGGQAGGVEQGQGASAGRGDLGEVRGACRRLRVGREQAGVQPLRDERRDVRVAAALLGEHHHEGVRVPGVHAGRDVAPVVYVVRERGRGVLVDDGRQLPEVAERVEAGFGEAGREEDLRDEGHARLVVHDDVEAGRLAVGEDGGERGHGVHLPVDLDVLDDLVAEVAEL